MRVAIKRFVEGLEIKSKGIELDVKNPGGQHVGDLVVTMSGLTWCRGKVTPAKGRKMTWAKFIAMMENS